MTSSLPHSQAAVRRIIALAVLILAVVVAGGVGLMTYTAVSTDRAQAAEERDLVSRRIDSLLSDLVQETLGVSVWDEAYETLTAPKIDTAWADTYVGRYYAEHMGHQISLVLDERDRTVYAWRGQARSSAEATADFRRELQPLIAQLREQETVNRRLSQSHLVAGLDGEIDRSGVVVSQGRDYLVAVATILPDDAPLSHHGRKSVTRLAGPARLLVTAREINGSLLKTLETELHIKDARLVPGVGAPKGARAQIVDVNGFAVGDIAWTPKRPGQAVLKQAAPILIVVMGVLLAAGLALAARIRAIVREMAASDSALGRTMAELVRARDQAAAASVAKSQFLANMSHEIRTPLNGILGMTQVMNREDLSAAQRDRLNVITNSGHTLLAVLNDVLDISKIEAGRLDIDNHEFDLGQAIEAACAAFTPLAAQKGVELRIEIEDAAQGVWWGDGGRLRQILSNLVSNAVKFTSTGAVTVKVGAAALGMRFSVRDSGIGIPDDRLSDLFQKFSQVDASTSRRFGGTGLGLAISKELAELMGGRMWVESRVGEGSTFSFELPLERRGAQLAPAEPAQATAAHSGGARILAAEDNATNQLILKALLEPFGVDLTVVSDGREAVEAWRAGDFDLILMDVQMPEMNGVEATAEIRALEAQTGRVAIPILALSANVMRHQVEEYLAVGMTGFVPKPIEATKLFAAIDVALAELEQGEAADAAAA
ncbi:ATP-binding protein [Phenylobacterium aquaticum]|uniref:ATP-binding protein n=1 Tax=Phenylobacterium aquaticum TaxID=1763816 RepID=UPI001F5C6C58|nr:ATP-binding protein [Phenylobacterium aquaticum]MCI3131016.1 ATP-binding protein [Phenylobacterium aquaticum]